MDPALHAAIDAQPGLAAHFAARPVLVTGGLGFVGSNLARTLHELGAMVTVVDNLAVGCGGTRANVSDLESQIVVHLVDQADAVKMAELAPQFEMVFNLVGRVSHIDSMSDPLSDLYTNVTAHLGLLEAFRRKNPKAKIVHGGSRCQYGHTDGRPTPETALPAAVDVNGVNKQAGEQHHFVYARAFGLRVVSLRLSNTYGPRMTLRSPANGVLPWFVRQALEGKELHLFGGGQQKRDCVYIDDVVLACLMAMRSDRAEGEVFNIGATPVSLAEVARLIVDAAGKGRIVDHPFPPEHKRVEVGDFVADCTKARAQLGWGTTTLLADGIARTVAFYRAHGTGPWAAG